MSVVTRLVGHGYVSLAEVADVNAIHIDIHRNTTKAPAWKPNGG